MVVGAGDADEMFDVAGDLGFLGAHEHDEAIRLLTAGDELHGAVERLAVPSVAGRVAMRHEGEHTQAGDAGLRVVETWEGAIGLLLRGEECEAAVDSVVD